jgi:hypothetical protein
MGNAEAGPMRLQDNGPRENGTTGRNKSRKQKAESGPRRLRDNGLLDHGPTSAENAEYGKAGAGNRFILSGCLSVLALGGGRCLTQRLNAKTRSREDAKLDLLEFVILKRGRGRHRKYLPFAFTEHGAIVGILQRIMRILDAPPPPPEPPPPEIGFHVKEDALPYRVGGEPVPDRGDEPLIGAHRR